MNPTLLRTRTHFEAPADPSGWYVPVPFEVPATAGPDLSVSVSYPSAGARLDVGLFDPDGFRGWSGSERSQLWVGPDGATPGYLPGPVPAGTWAVWLGLYVVPDGGVDVDIEVRAARPAGPAPTPPAPLAARPPRRQLPSEGIGTWLAGDLHCHTLHSDGALPVRDVAALARRAGLDFLAITDHNTVSHHAELPAAAAETEVELIPGQEVTSYSGHANALGPMGWVDFRGPADDWMAAVVEAGGLLSINHPTAGSTGWQRPLSRPPHLIELWPGAWDRRMGGAADAAFAIRASLGQATPVGGSDYHRPTDPVSVGRPTTWVLADDGDVLAGLRAGRTTISAGRDAPVIVPAGDTVIILDGDGTTLCDQAGRRRPITAERLELPVGDGLHWLEGDGRVEAVCEPGGPLASPVDVEA
ncbi:MAG TPA: CehA/McbA family metallohydrolase [Acidimicrobiales bacterium]